MIYSFSLSQVSVWAGLGLLLSHGWGLLDYRQATQWIRSFPRGDGFGGLLLALATGWSAWLAGTINLMEYTRFRPLFVLGVIIRFIDKFPEALPDSNKVSSCFTSQSVLSVNWPNALT